LNRTGIFVTLFVFLIFLSSTGYVAACTYSSDTVLGDQALRAAIKDYETGYQSKKKV
jgi:hypothetical protein